MADKLAQAFEVLAQQPEEEKSSIQASTPSSTFRVNAPVYSYELTDTDTRILVSINQNGLGAPLIHSKIEKSPKRKTDEDLKKTQQSGV